MPNGYYVRGNMSMIIEKILVITYLISGYMYIQYIKNLGIKYSIITECNLLTSNHFIEKIAAIFIWPFFTLTDGYRVITGRELLVLRLLGMAYIILFFSIILMNPFFNLFQK